MQMSLRLQYRTAGFSTPQYTPLRQGGTINLLVQVNLTMTILVRHLTKSVPARVATFVHCVPHPFNFQTVGATTRTVDLFEGHRG